MLRCDLFISVLLEEERLQLQRGTAATERNVHAACEEEWKRKERKQERETVLRGHFDGACRCVFGAVAVLWQCSAAPDAVCGADAGGRVSPGANQPGHTSCGHVAHPWTKYLKASASFPGCTT